MGQFEYDFNNNAAFTLDDALDGVASDFPDDFLTHWGLQSSEPPPHLERDEWLELRRIYGTASQLASIAGALVQRKGVGKDRLALGALLQQEANRQQRQIEDLLDRAKLELNDADYGRLFGLLFLPVSPNDSRTKAAVFENTLQIAAMQQFVQQPGRLARRLQSLATYLVRHANDRTAEYLARVAKCYVLDMGAELAVMSRAALESALESVLDDDEVRRTVGADRFIGLERRLEYCSAKGILDLPTRRAADFVKEVGDLAAHAAPNFSVDLDRLVQSLAAVLTAVHNALPPGRT
jgi:hypothetical protein